MELPPVGCRLGFTRDRRISIARNGDQTNDRITAARPMRSHRGQPLGLGELEGSGMGKRARLCSHGGQARRPWQPDQPCGLACAAGLTGAEAIPQPFLQSGLMQRPRLGSMRRESTAEMAGNSEREVRELPAGATGTPSPGSPRGCWHICW